MLQLKWHPTCNAYKSTFYLILDNISIVFVLNQCNIHFNTWYWALLFIVPSRIIQLSIQCWPKHLPNIYNTAVVWNIKSNYRKSSCFGTESFNTFFSSLKMPCTKSGKWPLLYYSSFLCVLHFKVTRNLK